MISGEIALSSAVMKFAPRLNKHSVPYGPALVFAIVGALLITGVIDGRMAGLLFALSVAGFGAGVWWADGVAWLEIASWTAPLAGLILVAWIAFDPIPYVITGLIVMAWLGSFIFWLPPVRWWYRWVLRRDPPRGNGPISPIE